jgi:hypothetical protein
MAKGTHPPPPIGSTFALAAFQRFAMAFVAALILRARRFIVVIIPS